MLAVIFVLAVYFIVRPAIRFTYNYFRSRGEVADSSLFAMLLFVMLFLCAFTAQVIGKWVRYQYANSVPNCNLPIQESTVSLGLLWLGWWSRKRELCRTSLLPR